MRNAWKNFCGFKRNIGNFNEKWKMFELRIKFLLNSLKTE